ncbi:MAG: hypothetical protein KGN77_14525 [Xanthomonadaceae bacterium]|nr:hypothetical protein [Xanthomonadaceae bacterium]MDE1964979.1 hypothetical protein [Xanthomonadaceae bacterium]
MSPGLLAQYVVVGVVLLASVLVVLRKLAPKLTARWLAAAALRLDRADGPAWKRTLAHRLQPKQTTGNCSDGCDTCGACGPKPPAAAHPPASIDAVPLHFRPRGK